MATEIQRREPTYVTYDENYNVIVEKNNMPSMLLPIGGAVFNGLSIVLQASNVVAFHSILPWWVHALFVIFFSVMLYISIKVNIPMALEKRALYRKEKYAAWLQVKPAELTEQTDWAEIERAMGELLREGTEPTYERAVDWLRKERQMLAEQEHAAEMARYRAQVAEDRAKARANPFRRNAPARCEHQDIDIFLTDQSAQPRYMCRECGRDVTPVVAQIEARNRRIPDQMQIKDNIALKAKLLHAEDPEQIAQALRRGLITENEARALLSWPDERY